MSIFNQYSFVFIILLLMVILAGVLFRKGMQKEKIIIFILVLVGVIAVWYWVKPTQNLTTSQEQAPQLIGSGKPVLLEFQSPY